MGVLFSIQGPAGNAPADRAVNEYAVLQAAYVCAHAYAPGMKALAVEMGLQYPTLKNKVDPSVASHRLALDEAVRLQYITGRTDVAQAMADVLGGAFVRVVPDQSDGDIVEAYKDLNVVWADFLRAAADALQCRGGVSRNAFRRCLNDAGELQGQVNHMLALLRAQVFDPSAREGS